MKKIMMIVVLVPIVSACTSPLLKTTGFRSFIYTTTPDSSSAKSSPDSPSVKLSPDTPFPKSLFTSSRIGMPYYLPTALIPITITYVKNSSNSSEDTKETKSKDQEKPSIKKNLEGQANINGQSPSPKPEDSTPAESSPAKPAEKPTNSVIHKMGPYEIKIDPPILVPDSSRMFYLEYNPVSATADDIKIGVGANQLLQTINAISTDKSGEALVTLAKIASYAMVLAAEADISRNCEDPSPVRISTFLDPTSIKGIQDDLGFNNPRAFSIDTLNNLLKNNNVPLKFDINTFGAVDTSGSDILSAKKRRQENLITELRLEKNNIANKNPQIEKELETRLEEANKELADTRSRLIEKLQDEMKVRTILDEEKKNEMDRLASDMEKIKTHPAGILFRAAEPYQLKISLSPDLNQKNDTLRPWCVYSEFSHTMVLAPSITKVYSIDVDRGALITKTTNLTIVDGMLTKIEVNKPSSLLGILNVPLEVIKAILSAPADLLTLRFQRVDKEAGIADAQAKKFERELDILNTIKDIQKSQSAE